ncbi:myosin-2 heavy chain-like [Anneissia japonica]|uniref:myosin-2 heavy chain-like n=1 Tax=Anneissia japonica TaxID=1529436 RepID=UPI001425A05A|nr:myosin-2 heavy chain-like [Anneissia japonica]XP_033126516.1 myosin-2 heavy chain-like [Anneissia japonica]
MLPEVPECWEGMPLARVSIKKDEQDGAPDIRTLEKETDEGLLEVKKAIEELKIQHNLVDEKIMEFRVIIKEVERWLDVVKMREQLETERKLMENKTKCLEDTIKVQEERIQNLQDLKTEIEKKSNDNKVLRMSNYKLEKTKREEIEEREKVTTELHEKIIEIQEVKHAKDTKIRDKNREIDDLKFESRKESFRMQAIEKEISTLREQIKAKDRQRRDLNEKIKRMEGQMRQLDEEKRGLSEKNEKMTEQIKQMEEQIKDMYVKNKNIKEELHVLEKEKKNQNETIKELKGQIKHLDKKIGELLIRERKLTASLNAMAEDKNRQTTKVIELETSLMKEKKTHNEQLRQRNKEHEKLVMSKDGRIRQLSEEVQRKEAELEATGIYIGLIPFSFIILVLVYAFFQ